MVDLGPSHDTAPLPVEQPASAPVPLPVGPGGKRSRWWIGVGVAAVLFALVLGGAGIAGVVYLAERVSPWLEPGDSGITRMVWAGDGRYAVIEYVDAGPPRAVSVVAWDSQTRALRRADGCRLVAIEPSSTQVWLSRPTTTTVPDDGGSFRTWDGPPMQGDVAFDGPGTPWVWDITSDEGPSRPGQTTWRPWKGPAGVTASLTVEPDTGLWPARLSFDATGSAPVVADLPSDATFLPVGWSATGRHFAVQIDEGDGLRVDVVDPTTGKVVASDFAPSNATTEDEPPTVWSGITGAAWDSRADSLIVLHYDTKDDGGTYRVWVSTLDPDGDPKAVRPLPDEWTDSTNQPLALGSDGGGFLVSVEIDGGPRIYRVAAGKVVSVGDFDKPDLLLEDSGTCSSRGLLVRQTPSDSAGLAADGRAAVCRLDGSGVRAIWPR